MLSNDPEIRIVEEWDRDEIHSIYLEAGWWRDWYDAGLIPLMIRGSFAFAVAVDRGTGNLAGMGRAISDGISDAYIQDLYVRKGFRRGGVGKQILESLVSYCRRRGIEWIGVMAEPGSDEFYVRSGFERLDGYVPMILGRDAP